MRKWLGRICTHCTNVNFLILILYYSYKKKRSLHHQQQKSVLKLWNSVQWNVPLQYSSTQGHWSVNIREKNIDDLKSEATVFYPPNCTAGHHAPNSFFIPSLHPKTFLVGKTKAFPRAMTFQVLLATVLLEFCWYKLEEIQLKVVKAK